MASHFSFTEREPYESGFGAVFADQIVPILQHHEAERKVFKRKALTGMGGAGVFGGGSVAGGIATQTDLAMFGGGMVGVIGVIGVRAYFGHKWKSALSHEIMPILCDFFGDITYGKQKIRVGEFRTLGVVPGYDNASLEDPVSGSYRGIDYALTEATLTKKSRDSKGRSKTTTVFRGLLIEIGLHNAAPRIYFAKERGSLGNWFSERFGGARSGMERIEIPHRQYESLYETYAENSTSAIAFVTPEIVEGLLEIGRMHGSRPRYISAAMRNKSFYIAIPMSKGFLDVGSLFRSLTGVEDDLHQALADLTLPKRVIDAFMGAAAG